MQEMTGDWEQQHTVSITAISPKHQQQPNWYTCTYLGFPLSLLFKKCFPSKRGEIELLSFQTERTNKKTKANVHLQLCLHKIFMFCCYPSLGVKHVTSSILEDGCWWKNQTTHHTSQGRTFSSCQSTGKATNVNFSRKIKCQLLLYI